MSRSNFNDNILMTIIRGIQRELLAGDESNVITDRYKKKYKNLPEHIQIDIIKRIVDSQSQGIIYGFENKLEVKLNKIGRFRMKKAREIVLNIKRKVLEDLGITDYHNADDETRAKVEEIVNSKKTKAYKDYKKKHGHLSKRPILDSKPRKSKSINSDILKRSLLKTKPKKDLK